MDYDKNPHVLQNLNLTVNFINVHYLLKGKKKKKKVENYNLRQAIN